MIKGKVHSIESAGLLDGPGIRTVVFFQGCKLRCIYCHNPDTWIEEQGEEIEVEDLFRKIQRFKPYFEKSGGGVTFSGGEPLLQPEFLISILKRCKEDGIHTAIDTAGYGVGMYDEILRYTDLILLDIKNVDDEGYIEITGKSKKGFDEFLVSVQNSDIPLWIRHVVVPGITDSIEHIVKLANIMKKINKIEKIELLPYHTLGKEKYKKMGLSYKLNSIEPMNKNKITQLEEILNRELIKHNVNYVNNEIRK